jgi:UDP-N-acetylglucosamine:LPS N-acetylglucosamine transferase
MNWLVPGEWAVLRNDVRSIEIAGLSFTDLLASVDAVITKPGYGTFVEAACSGIPILYLQRDDWPETPHFAAWLARHARAEQLAREQLLSGDFLDVLRRLWASPAPPLPQADGAGQAAHWLATRLVPARGVA